MNVYVPKTRVTSRRSRGCYLKCRDVIQRLNVQRRDVGVNVTTLQRGLFFNVAMLEPTSRSREVFFQRRDVESMSWRSRDHQPRNFYNFF